MEPEPGNNGERYGSREKRGREAGLSKWREPGKIGTNFAKEIA